MPLKMHFTFDDSLVLDNLALFNVDDSGKLLYLSFYVTILKEQLRLPCLTVLLLYQVVMHF